MRTLQKYIPFLLPAMLLCCIVAVIYPYCQYYIDPDATAYLTIAKRYAAGDIDKAINGYWSPWSCWLTALFIKAGIGAFASAIMVNVAGAVGLLYVSFLFFIKYRINNYLQWLLCTTLALFLCYAVFKQTFDDIWECFFLLYALRIMVSGRFKYSPALWILTGVTGALAYFAKAYSFPFFILNVVPCVFFITRAWSGKYIGDWLRISFIVIGVMILCSMPWIYLLHDKYGVWMTSTAGTLNTSWYLVGHPYWKAELLDLLPPVYTDSPTYWEDPWFVNGATPHFYSSVKLLLLQIAKMGYNILKLVQSMNELSPFFLFVWLMALGMAVSRKMRCFFANNKLFIPTLSFLLFPLGFVLINFESRYIWYMLPLSMVFGALVIQKMQKVLLAQSLYSRLIPLIFAASYIVWPIWDMKSIWNDGRQDHITANALLRAGVQESFSSNLIFGDDGYTGIQRIAYFNGSSYYTLNNKDVSFKTLLPQLRGHHVQYFLWYQIGSANISTDDIKDEYGSALPQVPIGLEGSRVKIFRLQ